MNDEVKKFVESKSTSELAELLISRLEEYKTATMDPDLTQSIPSLDVMIAIANEISQRVKS